MIVWNQGGLVDYRRRMEASSDDAGGESPPQEGAQHHGGGDLLESAVSCKLLFLKVIGLYNVTD